MPELQKVALTYNSWKNEIVNSFIINPITHQRLTNGFIECKNNFVKVIKKSAFAIKILTFLEKEYLTSIEIYKL